MAVHLQDFEKSVAGGEFPKETCMKTRGSLVIQVKLNTLPKSVASLEGGLVQFVVHTRDAQIAVYLHAEEFDRIREASEKFPAWVAKIHGKPTNLSEYGFRLVETSVSIFEKAEPSESEKAIRAAEALESRSVPVKLKALLRIQERIQVQEIMSNGDREIVFECGDCLVTVWMAEKNFERLERQARKTPISDATIEGVPGPLSEKGFPLFESRLQISDRGK
jgi:hypothetical protein